MAKKPTEPTLEEEAPEAFAAEPSAALTDQEDDSALLPNDEFEGAFDGEEPVDAPPEESAGDTPSAGEDEKKTETPAGEAEEGGEALKAAEELAKKFTTPPAETAKETPKEAPAAKTETPKETPAESPSFPEEIKVRGKTVKVKEKLAEIFGVEPTEAESLQEVIGGMAEAIAEQRFSGMVKDADFREAQEKHEARQKAIEARLAHEDFLNDVSRRTEIDVRSLMAPNEEGEMDLKPEVQQWLSKQSPAIQSMAAVYNPEAQAGWITAYLEVKKKVEARNAQEDEKRAKELERQRTVGRLGVRGQRGGGSPAKPSKDDFDAGFDSE